MATKNGSPANLFYQLAPISGKKFFIIFILFRTLKVDLHCLLS